MKNYLKILFLVLLVSGCATKPSNNYQYTDLNVIIIPKETSAREMNITRVAYDSAGNQSLETKSYTIPNIFYPNDSAYICSGEKAKKDLGAQIDNLSSTVKSDKCK